MAGTLRRWLGIPAPQRLAGAPVQSSIYGLPIPLVYGQARVAGNLIQFPNQPTSSAYQQADKKGRPKHMYGEVAIAICEGPIRGLGTVWSDQYVGTWSADYAPQSWSLYLGTSAPASWTTPPTAQQVPYQYTAYVTNNGVDMTGGHLKNYSWEVEGFLPFGGPNSILDASPKDVIYDLLTDPNHGFGWVPHGTAGSWLADWTTFAQYCAAAGLFISPVVDSLKPASDWLQEFLDIANSAAVWSDGTLKIIPFGDTSLTGNGQTYTPNTTPLYDLTDLDYLAAEGEDPVTVTRKAPADRYNQLTVEYEARYTLDGNGNPTVTAYAPNSTDADDLGAIQAVAAATGDNGLRMAPKKSYPAIRDPGVARTVAQLMLQREQYVANTYTFKLGWRYSLLEPMDLVTLTDAPLGLNRTPVRIVEVTELADEAGIQITAEDWPFGIASATLYATSQGASYQPSYNADPGNTAAPVIFDGPQPLQSSPLEIWIAASGGALWGGCEVWYSLDNTTFYQLGVLSAKANFGTLTALLPSAPAGSDLTDTLAVDLTVSAGQLASASATEYNALVPLCYVDGEFLAYETATLTATSKYNLTTLDRGVYNSASGSHAIGTNFVRCDSAVGHFPFPQGQSGQVVYFKFPAFNIYGGGLQDISTVTSVSFTIGTSPRSVYGPPLAWCELSSETDTQAVVSLDGSLGTNAPGPLQWRYRVSTGAAPGSWSSYSSAALPTTVTVTKLPKDTQTVQLEVQQGDGQVRYATWHVRAALPYTDETTGNATSSFGIQNNAGAAWQAFKQQQQQTKGSGSLLTWGTAFDSAPQIILQQSSYTIPAGATVPYQLQFQFQGSNPSVSGTVVAQYVNGTTSSAKTEYWSTAINTFPGVSGGVTISANNAIVYCDLGDANANSTTYSANYNIDTTNVASTNKVTVYVYVSTAANPTTSGPWNLVGSKVYPGGNGALNGESLAWTAAEGANYSVKLQIVYQTAPGTGQLCTLTAVSVTFNQLTPGGSGTLTSGGGDGITVTGAAVSH